MTWQGKPQCGRYALKNGGDADVTIPDDNLRLLLAEQLDSITMANEILMRLREKRHLFNIRPIYVPTSPDDFEECVAKVWARIWPDCRYPRYDIAQRPNIGTSALGRMAGGGSILPEKEMWECNDQGFSARW